VCRSQEKLSEVVSLRRQRPDARTQGRTLRLRKAECRSSRRCAPAAPRTPSRTWRRLRSGAGTVHTSSRAIHSVRPDSPPGLARRRYRHAQSSVRITIEYTDQYITDSKNHSCATFTFSTNDLSISLRPGFYNILGQYSTNIPAQTRLAHNPSAGLRTPFPPRFKTWV
jgi:hypothetical protein